MNNISKISIGLNAVLIATLVYFAIKKPPITSSNCNNICMDYSANPSYSLIDGSELKRMATNFKNSNQHGITNTATPPGTTLPDANSVWFGLEDLKKFIWKIENSVCRNKCPNTPALDLGIRIYYARYPGTGQYDRSPNGYFSTQPDEYENMHTVFMIPTYKDLTLQNTHVDFYLDSAFDKKSCFPINIPAGDRAIGKVSALLVDPDGKNHGSLCPPLTNCGGAAF
jgi:hypothetical protein